MEKTCFEVEFFFPVRGSFEKRDEKKVLAKYSCEANLVCNQHIVDKDYWASRELCEKRSR